MSNECSLCERRKDESAQFCPFHLAAAKNLEDSYVKWRDAYGEDFTKELYYAKLEHLDETGQGVKDVLPLLRKSVTR
jgi:hypothetical protein